MDLANSRRKNSPQLFNQSKRKYISIRSNRRWLLMIRAISISGRFFNFMPLQQGSLCNYKFCMASSEAAIWEFCKKAALKIYAELTGTHRCWSLFLIKFQGFSPVNFLKRDSEADVCFSVNLVIFLRTPIFENICELLPLDSKYYAPSNNTAESVAEYS